MLATWWEIGETHETMKKTLAAAMRFKTDTAQFFPLIPYPGTGAYNWAKSNGYINGKYDEYIHEDGTLNCIINTPELSAQELVDFCAYATKEVLHASVVHWTSSCSWPA
ncbi:MAG: hypothetical protein ACLT8Y_07020 [Dorea formicigenerans]